MNILNISRRGFLRTGASLTGGLVLALPLAGAQGTDKLGAAPFGAVVRIGPDNIVTVVVGQSEMGQGVLTTVPMVIADEMGADWPLVRYEQGPNDGATFGRARGGVQITAGSGTQRVLMKDFLNVGAVARDMLTGAAAQRWSLAPGTLRAERGRIIAPDGRSASFGELAAAAAEQPVPTQPVLKPRSEWTLIGTSPPRLDVPDKVTGRAVFGMDVKLPGLLVAMVARPPVFGSSVESFDASDTLKVEGVRSVHQVSSGVAVVAAHYWAAKRGIAALKLKWRSTAHDTVDTAVLRAGFVKAASAHGMVADQRGDIGPAFAGAATTVEATYETQYLSHSCMEPINHTAWVHDGIVEIWAGVQSQTFAETAAAKIAGLPVSKARIHTTLLGGGMGRRVEETDTIEAVEVAMAAGGPVKVIWSREDDMRHDFYRPMSVNRLRAGLDSKGNMTCFHARLSGQSTLARGQPERLKAAKGVDYHINVNIADMAYDKVPHVLVEQCRVDTHVPVGFWRSVGSSGNVFVMEGFIDEVAHAAKKDPVAFRLELIGTHERHRRVLEAVADKSGWWRPLAAGAAGVRRGRGVAVSEVFSGWVAQVVEVSVAADNSVSVDRIVVACDFGTVVHPQIVESQVIGAVVCGLDNALHNEIRIENGAVVNSNFHDNPLPRMTDVPRRIEVHVLPLQGPPGGVGEPATPAVAPALANALFAATGQRLRSLPLRLGAVAA